MNFTARMDRTASTRRMVIGGIAVFIALMLAGALALWAKLGTAVFFEMIATGIAYCF